MKTFDDIIYNIELHSVVGLRKNFKAGVDPNLIFNNKPLIYELISGYNRTPRFSECVRTFLEYGLNFEDEVLLAVLLDDAGSLEKFIRSNPKLVFKPFSMDCAYTPFQEVTLLHICAEFNHISCAEVLVKYGADINAKGGVDEFGFGGQTPIFHTVNQNKNNSIDMLDYLLSESAELNITLNGIIWGKGYPWETLIPSINPISYAMMGLLPQMHRDEVEISNIVRKLIGQKYGIDYKLRNVPCKYLVQ